MVKGKQKKLSAGLWRLLLKVKPTRQKIKMTHDLDKNEGLVWAIDKVRLLNFLMANAQPRV